MTNPDPIDLIDGLITIANVSKSETNAELKAVLRRFGDSDEIRNTSLSGRNALYLSGKGIYEKDTGSIESDDDDNFIVDGDGIVWSKFSGGGGTGALEVDTTTISGGTSGGLLFNKAGVLGNLSTILVTDDGTFSISPTANSLTQGLSVTQSGPTSVSSTAGEFDYNSISVDHRSTISSSGPNPFATNVAAALKVTMTTGGANVNGFGIAGLFRINHTVGATNATADWIALASQAYSNKIESGTSGLYGKSSIAYAAATAGLNHMAGDNSEVTMLSGAAINFRVGYRAQSTDSTAQAATSDAAFTVVSSGGADLGFKKMFNLSEFGNAQSIKSTGDIFAAQQALTVANFANLSNLTVTGNILNFPNATLSGAGAYTGVSVALGGALISGSKLSVQGTFATGPSIKASQTDGASSTTGYSQVTAQSDVPEIGITAFGSAFNSSGYGVTLGGWARLQAAALSGTLNGLIIGVIPDKPTIFGNNNIEQMRLSTSGLQLGASGKLTPLLFGNATSGTVTLQPVTGALGTVTLSLPAANDTLVGKATTDTLTNKTLTSPLISVHIGGTGTTGIQSTFQTTTGNGTTDAFAFKGGNNGATTFLTLNATGLGFGTAPTQAFTATINSTSANGSQLTNSNSGGVVSWAAFNDTGTVAEFGVRGTARASYGTLLANEAYFYSAGNLTFMSDNASGIIKWAAGGNALRMQLSAAGGLSIGATTDAGAGGLLINGQLYGANIATTASAANAFIDTATTPAGQLKRSTSSRRYKTNIQGIPVEDAIRRIMALDPIKFNSLASADDKHREFIGLVAEDVVDVDDRLINYMPDENGRLIPDGVQYDRIAVLLAKMGQQHERRLNQIENKLH